jgi:hypothetical protein
MVQRHRVFVGNKDVLCARRRAASASTHSTSGCVEDVVKLNPGRRAWDAVGSASLLMGKMLITLRARLGACTASAYHHPINQRPNGRPSDHALISVHAELPLLTELIPN